MDRFFIVGGWFLIFFVGGGLWGQEVMIRNVNCIVIIACYEYINRFGGFNSLLFG